MDAWNDLFQGRLADDFEGILRREAANDRETGEFAGTPPTGRGCPPPLPPQTQPATCNQKGACVQRRTLGERATQPRRGKISEEPGFDLYNRREQEEETDGFIPRISGWSRPPLDSR